jgi:la-related protein 1
MAISATTLTAEMSQPTFSYAQAAKGQVAQPAPQPTSSPAPASVSSKDDATTVSTAVTAPSVASNDEVREPTKPQADNESGLQKQESETPLPRESSNASKETTSAAKGDSTSTQSATEEKVQRPAGRSSRATDAESRKGRKGKKAKREDKDADSEGDKAQEQAEKEPPKPVILSEAPIPSVNPWHQRKAATSAGVQNGTSAEKSHRKSTDLSRAADQLPRRSGPRGSRVSEKDEKNGAESLPSVADSSLWPDVKSAAVAVDDGKKKSQDKTEQKVEKDVQGHDDASSSKKKKGWVAIPYVPTVNFQTPMPQRSSKPRGGARGGREAGSSRGTHNNATSPTVTSPTTDKAQATSTAKEGRPREGSNAARANSLPPSASKRASVDMSSTRDVRKPAVTDVRLEDSSASSTTKAEGSRTGRTEFNPAASEHQSQYASRNFSERRGDLGIKGYEGPKDQGFAPRERGEGQGRGRGGFRGRGNHNGSVGGHGPQPGYTNGQYPVHPLPGRPNNGPYSPPAHQNGFGNGFGAGSSRGNGRGNGRGGSGSAGYSRVNSNGAGPSSKMAQGNAGNVNFDYSMQQYPAFMQQQPVYDPTTVQFVMTQVEYYLSVDNLCKDFFIRKRMDSQGFVPFDLVAGFRRLKELAPDVEYIRLACEASDKIDYVVGEDHVERLRLREKWDQFVLDVAEREEEARNNGPTQWMFRSRHSRTPYAPPMMPVGYHPATSPGIFNPGFPSEEQMYQQSYMNGAGHYDAGMNGGDMNGHHYAPETQLSAAVPEFSPTIPQGPQHASQQVPFTLEGATTFSDHNVDNLMIVTKKESVQSPGAEAPAVNGNASSEPQANGADEDAARLVVEVHSKVLKVRVNEC